MGTDSFTPDSGVLLAKTKNSDNDAPFEWVIDANPQDIGMTDYVLPDGTEVPITIGDYRQLSDALFHAGADSGSEFEYVDQANRLHFYVLDAHRTKSGELSYTVAIRSLDGSGPQRRGVAAAAGGRPPDRRRLGALPLPAAQHRPGRRGGPASGGRERAISGRTCTGCPPTPRPAAGRSGCRTSSRPPSSGAQTSVTVYAKRESGSHLGRITLTATSESDASKTDTATCLALAR